MPRIRYVGGVSAVDIPLLGLTDVATGSEFDATDDQADALLLATDNYVLADTAAPAPADPAQEG